MSTEHRSKAMEACKEGLFTWEEVCHTPSEWRDDVHLSLAAYSRGAVQDLADVPLLTSTILSDSVKLSILSWQNISSAFRNDLCFCRSVLNSVEPDASLSKLKYSRIIKRPDYFIFDTIDDAAVNMFGIHPQLCQDRQVWENLFNTYSNSSIISRLMRAGFLPTDGDMLERICRKWMSLLESIDQIHYAELVQNLIRENAKCVLHAKTDFIESFPDFVIQNLARLGISKSDAVSQYTVEDFAENIPAEMWNNEELVRIWFEVGLPVTIRGQPEIWKSDRTKLLRVAEHGAKRSFKYSSFDIMTDEMKDDIDFITEAMNFEPTLFFHASERLRHANYDLAIWAMSDSAFASDWHARGQIQRDLVPIDFFIRSDQELKQHAAFVKVLLCGVWLANDQSPLWNLKEQPFLQSIAEFVGIPRGDHLCNLRRMAHNCNVLYRKRARSSTM